MISEESLKIWEQENIKLLTSKEMGEWLYRRDKNRDDKVKPQGDCISREVINSEIEIRYCSKHCALPFGEPYCPDSCPARFLKNIVKECPSASDRSEGEWLCPNCDLYDQAEDNYCQYAGECTLGCRACRYFKQKDG